MGYCDAYVYKLKGWEQSLKYLLPNNKGVQ